VENGTQSEDKSVHTGWNRIGQKGRKQGLRGKKGGPISIFTRTTRFLKKGKAGEGRGKKRLPREGGQKAQHTHTMLKQYKKTKQNRGKNNWKGKKLHNITH